MSTLIENGHVVTMNAGREVFDGGYVLVGDDGRIASAGPAGTVPKGPFDERLDAKGMIVLPGLINLHQHHWYNLFKGLAPGMLLEEWVSGLLLPCAAELSADDLRASAYLSALEMVRTGTTCCLNHSVTTTMEAEVAATVEPMAEIGFRQVFAKDFRCQTPANPQHPHNAGDAADYIGELVDTWHGAKDGLVRMALAIESNAHWLAAGMSSDELVETGYRLAVDKGLQITNHTAGGTLSLETGYLHYLRQTGRTDVRYLVQMGILDAHWLLIHAINVTDTDIAQMAEAGCHAVYTPTSESMRGGGIGPWVRLINAGVNCALGTDGPMVDYSVDIVEQMKVCTFVQNTNHLDPTVMPIERSLEMATINAARALGMADEIGSLEAGKRADIAVFDLRGPHIQVIHNPIANFVCCARGADAHTVLIDGETVLSEGRFIKFANVDDVIAEATERGRAIATKAGVIDRARPIWPQHSAATAAQ
ncbi:MAG: amidohydrolase family protein [Alphaproteobacteria bacterium]|nr:amidohydrolase family protein [Alphaproteobacteria bacterium]